jgi:carbon storage regulator
MLVLSRKPGESIQVGHDITVTVLKVQGNRVRLGFEAPRGTRIMRWELEVESKPADPRVGETAIA